VIQFVDQAIEGFLRQRVPLPEATVELSFDAPDRAWGAAVTRPTVNLFLWQIKRNVLRSQTGLQQRQAVEGGIERRPASPVVDMHYLVTTWASEQDDEHLLLGSVLTCLLSFPKLPEEHIPAQLPRDGPLGLALASEGLRSPGEFWSALGGRLKPGLEMEVTVPIDVYAWTLASASAESLSLTSQRMQRRPRMGPAVATTPRLPRRRTGTSTVVGGSTAQDGAGPADPAAQN
jgi:hypothetical protein